MYNKIYEFCRVRNSGNCFKNGEAPTPRVQFLLDLCEAEGIPYELDVWSKEGSVHSDLYIEDFPKFSKRIPKDKLKTAEDLYSDFLDEVSSISVQPKNGFEPGSFDDLSPEDQESYLDAFFEIEKKYSDQLRTLLSSLPSAKNNFFNVMLLGNSDKFVVAHHDIVNPNSDNANDNSCSVINALAIKKLRPDVNVVLLDGEEPGGIGSKRLSERIKAGDFSCRWILNLELTGKGGKNFFVGDMGTPLTDWIADRFECPIVHVPFNDSVVFKRYGINSTVINPLPLTEETTSVVNKDGKFLDSSLLFLCHRTEDSLDKISPADMEEFVKEICLKIIDEA